MDANSDGANAQRVNVLQIALQSTVYTIDYGMYLRRIVTLRILARVVDHITYSWESVQTAPCDTNCDSLLITASTMNLYHDNQSKRPRAVKNVPKSTNTKKLIGACAKTARDYLGNSCSI